MCVLLRNEKKKVCLHSCGLFHSSGNVLTFREFFAKLQFWKGLGSVRRCFSFIHWFLKKEFEELKTKEFLSS